MSMLVLGLLGPGEQKPCSSGEKRLSDSQRICSKNGPMELDADEPRNMPRPAGQDLGWAREILGQGKG